MAVLEILVYLQAVFQLLISYKHKMNFEIQEQIKAHALEDQTKECCGLIAGGGIYKCRNISTINDHFLIDSKDYFTASLLGKISAVYHSHVNGNNDFSDFDKQMSDNLNIKYV